MLLPSNPAPAKSRILSVDALCGLIMITSDGSEREMKRVVLNRKNSLFVGNPRGGRIAGNKLTLPGARLCKYPLSIPEN